VLAERQPQLDCPHGAVYKLAEAVGLRARRLNVGWEGLRRTEGGLVAADLTISVGGIAVKYNVYLQNAVELQFRSTDRSRVELAARPLRPAGVSAEVKKAEGKDVWYIRASTDMLAAGRIELRDALANIVREAAARGWVDAGKAERWLKKLEEGLTLKKGWPEYEVRLAKGALVVRYRSTNPDNIKQETQRLREMDLVEGDHFTVETEVDSYGYVYIRKEGLAHAAWLSVYGKDEQQRRLAAKFVELILRRVEEAGEEVYEKAQKIIEEGMSRSSLTLKGFEKEVEVNGKKYKVKVIGGVKKLLRLRVTAEVDGVRRECTITYGRYGRNAAVGFAVARADVPGGREADAERLSALIEALTGVKPKIRRRKDGTIVIECYGGHLEGFRRFAELADAIEKWLEKTSRR
jgi:hypothetical protein